jgi:nitrogen-specific signal transduction histidine kinase
VRLEAVPPASPPPLTGRREALRAALVNLALNAIDAVGRDGRVRIETRLADGFLELAVEDDGPGPPAALADSLAEPFVTGKQEGIGLGLAVAKAVAEEHGGKLSWSRQPGRTRFVIALPLPAGHPSHQDRDP